MNGVQKTLFIPLYGKAWVSEKDRILHDPKAEAIWRQEAFPIRGKSKSKWLCYNMAMRARVFDDWTRQMLERHRDATVIHMGCGLDSRCLRVDAPESRWIDCDFPEVIAVRKKYYTETGRYSMQALDATCQSDLRALPDAPCGVVILEGISMYLTNRQLRELLVTLSEKYRELHVLMDVYTTMGAKASKFKNPVNEVGVTTLYGVDDVSCLCEGTAVSRLEEHSFTPDSLVNELTGFDRWFFKKMFTGNLYRKVYRLYELTSDETRDSQV